MFKGAPGLYRSGFLKLLNRLRWFFASRQGGDSGLKYCACPSTADRKHQHLKILKDSSNIPLVLHGGSGIPREFISAGIKCGISKINVGSELRRAYQVAYEKQGSVSYAASSLYHATREFIRVELETTNSKDLIG